ncbi:hypothetical protein F5Y08DRAFT_318082 [Xylaria arbuscula]|nr:hypothetical protein F5Y08DRAFT_318082 [Xylaria arbuscula]
MDSDSDAPRPRTRPTRDLPSRQAKIKAPARHTRATAAYFATTPSQTQTSASPTETDADNPARHRRSLRQKRKTFATVTKPTPPPEPNKRRRLQSAAVASPSLPHSRPHASSKDTVEDASPEDRLVIPPWHKLPYHVWLQVFDYVATPIRNPASRTDDFTEAIESLLSGARTCRRTCEPALAALYRCPPFDRAYTKSPQTSFVQFIQTLTRGPSKMGIRYWPKVETLRINVEVFLTRKVNGQQVQLKQLLQHLPRLASLEFYHPSDDPPYRELDTHLRWKFDKDDLLHGLGPTLEGQLSDGSKNTTTTLRSWRWNSRLTPGGLSLDHLPGIHALPSFQTLRKLAFVNYQLPSTKLAVRVRQTQEAQDSDKQAIAQLAASISALPDLQHLIIESSTLANGSLLEQLPKTLVHLELVNCWEITSEDLSAFLVSHGNSLIKLTLKHCQSMSLGFLPVLGTSCPNLKHLDVDLSYFRHHEAYADNKPEYTTLLGVDDVPTWPSSIQSIEIINMRNWTREAAEMFFDSLIRNAKTLPNLRRLEFKVILNIEWRQRQELRQALADQMTKVFKRKSSSPENLTSLRHYHEQKRLKSSDQPQTSNTTRRSTRSTKQMDITDLASTPNIDPSKGGPRKLRPFKRRLNLSKPNSTFDADDEYSSEDELSLDTLPPRKRGRTATAKEAGLRGGRFIHGLCDVVDIQVDNQRPAERQFDMDDFLDSPEESDPEWNSDEDDVFT